MGGDASDKDYVDNQEAPKPKFPVSEAAAPSQPKSAAANVAGSNHVSSQRDVEVTSGGTQPPAQRAVEITLMAMQPSHSPQIDAASPVSGYLSSDYRRGEDTGAKEPSRSPVVL